LSSLTVSLICLVCAFGGALLGMRISRVLPESHLSESSRDTLKVMTGLMATLAALILGLLIASAKSSYDRANDDFRQLAAKVVQLDRALAEYGPETKEVRASLFNAYKARMDQLFPTAGMEAHPGPMERRPLQVEQIETRLRALLPASDAKRAHMERALQLVDQMANSGWVLTIEESDNALPAPMLVVLIAWLAAMFVGFGMLAPRNATVGVALLIGALSVSASIFLIEEMNHPLDGMIQISGTPLRNALRFLGQ
jgi:hypothetical protein